MARPQLLRFNQVDPRGRVATPSRPWIVLGQNASFFPNGASKLYLPGLQNSFLSTPDTAAMGAAMLTSWEFRCCQSLNDWGGNGQNRGLWGQQVSIANADTSWSFLVSSSTKTQAGELEKADHTGMIPLPMGGGAYSGWADGDGIFRWTRMTWDPSVSQGSWYTSPDGVTWSFVNTVTNALVTTCIDSTQPVRVGCSDPTTWGTNGGLYGYVRRWEFRSPINGPIICGFDARQAQKGAATLRGLAGETWSINGTAAFQ